MNESLSSAVAGTARLTAHSAATIVEASRRMSFLVNLGKVDNNNLYVITAI